MHVAPNRRAAVALGYEQDFAGAIRLQFGTRRIQQPLVKDPRTGQRPYVVLNEVILLLCLPFRRAIAKGPGRTVQYDF